MTWSVVASMAGALSWAAGCSSDAPKKPGLDGQAPATDGAPEGDAGDSTPPDTDTVSATTSSVKTDSGTDTATDTDTEPDVKVVPHAPVWDFDGDGKSDLVKLFNDGTSWSAEVYVAGGKTFDRQAFASGQGTVDPGEQWFPGDFDGDGKWDVARIWPDATTHEFNAEVYLSTGTAFNYVRFATNQGNFTDDNKWLVGDFDGDGKSDFVTYFKCGTDPNFTLCADLYASTGTAFTKTTFADQQGTWTGDQYYYAADFDGDKKWDLAKFWNDNGLWSCDVHLSDGTAFTQHRWATQQGGYIYGPQWTVGDFNGDGKADFAKYFDDGGFYSLDVHLSKGDAFTIGRWATKAGDVNLGMQWVVGDFNGDGKSDYASYWMDQGSWTAEVHSSSGHSFGLSRWATKQGGNFGGLHWVTGDFNADGRTDFASYWECVSDPEKKLCSDVHLSTGKTFDIARWTTENGLISDDMIFFPYRSQ